VIGTDEALLLDESIDSADLFCAITDNDGVNIIPLLGQRAWGHEKQSVCLIIFRTLNYCPVRVLMSPVLPNQETLGSILKHVRRGDVAQVTSLCEVPPRLSRPLHMKIMMKIPSLAAVWTPSIFQKAL